MCLAAASYAVRTFWSWRSSLERTQVARRALPRIHGTHICLAALIVYTRILRWRVSRVAHPLITERESLIIGDGGGKGGKEEGIASRSQSAPTGSLCARYFRNLLGASSSRFNYTTTVRNINSSFSHIEKPSHGFSWAKDSILNNITIHKRQENTASKEFSVFFTI